MRHLEAIAYENAVETIRAAREVGGKVGMELEEEAWRAAVRYGVDGPLLRQFEPNIRARVLTEVDAARASALQEKALNRRLELQRRRGQ